jgi:hypothetical protein
MNGQQYVVPELSTTFQQWVNRSQDFIGTAIMPEVPVEDMERFLVWNGGREHLIIPSTTLRFGRTQYAEATFSQATSEKGPLEEHGLSDFITDRQYRVSSLAGPLSIENRITEGLASKMALRDEKDVADTLSNTSIVTHYDTLSGTDQWSDPANSNPIEDIKTMVINHSNNSSAPANAAWCSWLTWMALITHPVVIDKIKWTNAAGVVTQDQFISTILAPLGINKLYVAKVRYNSANEGQAASMSYVWPKHFWIGYVTDQPGQFEQNGGYKFTGGPNVRRVMKESKMNPPGAEIITSDFYSHIILDASVYYMLQNVIA